MSCCERGDRGCGGVGDDDDAVAPEAPPVWLGAFDAQAAARIDVRPLLAAGRDPFEAIMGLACPRAVGDGLIIEAPFNPVPLRRVLSEQGFETFAERLAAGHWQLLCQRLRPASLTVPANAGTGQGARVWRENDGVHIDVRDLSPPAPLVAIVRLLESDAHSGIIVAHLNRDPVHLYPELAERQWSAVPLPSEPGEVRLRLCRAGA